jgi:hypothetical protein
MSDIGQPNHEIKPANVLRVKRPKMAIGNKASVQIPATMNNPLRNRPAGWVSWNALIPPKAES